MKKKKKKKNADHYFPDENPTIRTLPKTITELKGSLSLPLSTGNISKQKHLELPLPWQQQQQQQHRAILKKF